MPGSNAWRRGWRCSVVGGQVRESGGAGKQVGRRGRTLRLECVREVRAAVMACCTAASAGRIAVEGVRPYENDTCWEWSEMWRRAGKGRRYEEPEARRESKEWGACV